MILEERLKTHHETLSRAILFTRVADRKAAPILVIQIALVGALAARSESLLSFIANDPNDPFAVILMITLFAYLVLFGAAVVVAARVYMPMTPSAGTSLIYFEDIQSIPEESFVEQARHLDPEEIESQLLQQIYAVSQIASIKMQRVRWAFFLSVPASVLWVALIVWGSI